MNELATFGSLLVARPAAKRFGVHYSSKRRSHLVVPVPRIFGAQGVKANVLFFDRKPAAEKPWTEKLWIYDLRANKHFTLKENPLKRSDLDDFVACYVGREGSPQAFAGDSVNRPYLSRHERKESGRFKELHLRRANQARQAQPRHLLAKRRKPRRQRQSSRSRCNRSRDRRRSPSSLSSIR